MPNNVNLAPSEKFESGTAWEKMYLWGANIGKTIIIITNFVIISIWLYRWHLDREIYELAIDIENKQLAITSISKTEEKIRKVQNKLNAIRDIENSKTYYTHLTNSFDKSTTNEVKINRIAFPEKQTINVTADAQSGVAFAKYVGNLLSNEEIKEVTLYNSSLQSTTGMYSFTIEVKIGEKET